MRFLCCGPMLGVECWGDWRPSETPSLGLRCTGVPFGVGDLLIFYYFAVGVLQPGVDPRIKDAVFLGALDGGNAEL